MDISVLIGGALAIGVGMLIYRSGAKKGSGCGCGCSGGCCGGETLEDEIYEENDEDRGCCDDEE